MTAKIRNTIYGLLLFICAGVASLIIFTLFARSVSYEPKLVWILWVTSLFPTAVSAVISTVIYNYLCESQRRWVHILWYFLNLSLIVAFAPFIAYIVMKSLYG